ncbi:MAG: alpha/beta fold hydrolase [Solirubrobacteraceae bacterium]|nr:alpha/beta fold hydrolase [Solirubrobacteraceae bacterium]
MGSERLIAEHRAAGRAFAAGGVASFVREEGEGEAVVCLHGIPASSFLYRKVLPELSARGLRGVAFDLPGFGLAERPPDFGYDWPGHGAWAAAALDALGIERFHLVCHDYGGPVGFELCARVPERIASLTVLDTVVDVERFTRPKVLDVLLGPGPGDALLRALPGALWHQAMLRLGVLDRRALTRAESDAWLELLRGPDHGHGVLETARRLQTTPELGARYVAAVRALDAPRQLIWGTADPVLPLASDGERAHAVVGGPLHAVPARHFLQEEQAEAIALHVARLARAAASA